MKARFPLSRSHGDRLPRLTLKAGCKAGLQKDLPRLGTSCSRAVRTSLANIRFAPIASHNRTFVGKRQCRSKVTDFRARQARTRAGLAWQLRRVLLLLYCTGVPPRWMVKRQSQSVAPRLRTKIM